jgi:hypothetical protein
VSLQLADPHRSEREWEGCAVNGRSRDDHRTAPVDPFRTFGSAFEIEVALLPRVDWQAQKREKPGKHDADRQQRRGNGPSNERDGGVHSGWPAVRPHRR